MLELLAHALHLPVAHTQQWNAAYFYGNFSSPPRRLVTAEHLPEASVAPRMAGLKSPERQRPTVGYTGYTSPLLIQFS